jgi:DNA-binding NarL/FixJ family response regulator
VYELDEPHLNDVLTTRERHALALARLGWQPWETATLLDIEPAAVSRAVDSAIDKLGANSLENAIERAWREGILR